MHIKGAVTHLSLTLSVFLFTLSADRVYWRVSWTQRENPGQFLFEFALIQMCKIWETLEMYSTPALFIWGRYKGCIEFNVFFPLLVVDNIDMLL